MNQLWHFSGLAVIDSKLLDFLPQNNLYKVTLLILLENVKSCMVAESTGLPEITGVFIVMVI